MDEERQIVRRALQDWNDLHAEAEGIVLQPRMWETHAVPEVGDRPQAVVNKHVVAKSDLLIGMFWTKMGTDTGVAESGTVEEINEMVRAGKPAMLYFSKRPVDPSKLDARQVERLKTFRDETCRTALVGTFREGGELHRTVLRDLTRRVREMKGTTPAAHDPSVAAAAAAASAAAASAGDDFAERFAAERDRFEMAALSGQFRNLVADAGNTIVVTYCLFPRTAPNRPIDLAGQRNQIEQRLRPLGGGGDRGYATHGKALVAFAVERREEGDIRIAVTELTATGRILSATHLPCRNLLAPPGTAARVGVRFHDVEGELLERLRAHIDLLRAYGVAGEFWFGLSVHRVRGRWLMPTYAGHDLSNLRQIEEDSIVADPVVLKPGGSYADAPTMGRAVKGALDNVWRECGLDHDPVLGP